MQLQLKPKATTARTAGVKEDAAATRMQAAVRGDRAKTEVAQLRVARHEAKLASMSALGRPMATLDPGQAEPAPEPRANARQRAGRE